MKRKSKDKSLCYCDKYIYIKSFFHEIFFNYLNQEKFLFIVFAIFRDWIIRQWWRLSFDDELYLNKSSAAGFTSAGYYVNITCLT